MKTFKAQAVQVVTGDIIVAVLTLPFNIKYETRIRLKDIRCPEARNSSDVEQQKKAVACVDRVVKLLEENPDIRISIHDETPGRVLGVVHLTRELTLNDALVAEGYAKPFTLR